jgi:hydrogenase/urease accessory protein HupE
MKRWVIILTLLIATPLFAHEMRPAFLELNQTGSETYDVLWKVPAIQNARLALYVTFPNQCIENKERRTYQAAGSFIERISIQCKNGLIGSNIFIEGLSATFTDVLARVQRIDGTTQIARLTPSAPSFTVEATPNWKEMAGTYLHLGTNHILMGLDHLLFVLGLLVIVGRRWKLMFKTITSFTLAHSLTLAGATLGLVHVPAEPLSAVIALSILFLGVEVARMKRGGTSITIRHPWVAAFGFGLVHGFGFASGLSTLGLPSNEIVAALLFFNIGVELGQIAFVALYLIFVRSLKTLEVPSTRLAEVMPAYVIGTLGAYWTFVYVAKFFE